MGEQRYRAQVSFRPYKAIPREEIYSLLAPLPRLCSEDLLPTLDFLHRLLFFSTVPYEDPSRPGVLLLNNNH